ncbi:MAG: phosphotransferase [Acidimicrobiales bacterium]
MIDANAFLEQLGPYLARQRWYSGTEEPASLRVVEQSQEQDGWPALVRMIVVDADGAYYQILLGARPSHERPDFSRSHDEAIVAEFGSADGHMWVYDATIDPDLGLALLRLVGDGVEKADHVRPVGGEQSNTSLVYDDRLIVKFFRRLHPGRNLDVEMTEALSAVGFDHVARPLATWRSHADHDFDLAVLQPFLVGGVDGWALALTSLRDLFGVNDTQSVPVITDLDVPPPAVDPAEAGGDFSADARRLGTITAAMHVAMIKAFGRGPGDAKAWADQIAGQVQRVDDARVDRRRAMRIVDDLRALSDPGPSIRVHGDYHLGQVLRTDAGWFVLDFEGEPARPPEERRRPSSPLRDVAGMLRSFHYASAVALNDRDEDGAEAAAAWESRNRRAFLDGYMRSARRSGILPDQASTEAVVVAFELEKAVYELAYETAYRPEWVFIPLVALKRLGAG